MADLYVFKKLTPFEDVDIGVYEDAINYVFQNDDIKNVAISGAYGSGKSSLLASYKKKNNTHKFLHISLSHFRTDDEIQQSELSPTLDLSTNEDKSIKDKSDISGIEGKILNQLIHQIPSERIQQSNFKIKRTVRKRILIFQSIAIAIFVLALLHITMWSDWCSYVELLKDDTLFKSILSSTVVPHFRLISGGVIAVLGFCFIYYVVKMQNSKNILRKLNVQGNEIEIFENSDDSYFDKYLNEVLYLFENIDADVIVFEDIDRFEASNIFERLHEINILANIKRKRKLKFFYLLRDDIFISKDRTKFFDFIIPVVPVVDSSNSYNKLMEILKANTIFEKFNESFLQGLSLYIDDMRLLINICNEFLIYINRLNIIELDYNKMFAIITYKNLFPKDFSDLQINRGFIYSLFLNKDKYINDEKVKLENMISKKEDEIEHAKRELAESIQELEDIYKAKKGRIPPQYTSQHHKCEEELNEWHKNEYPKRKQAIENKINNRTPILEEELKELKDKHLSLKSCKLYEVITRENIDNIFKLTTTNEIGKEETYIEIKANPYFSLLKYLVRNGHIDESYSDYMTYFYENNLTITDKVFLRSITDRKSKEYSYKLDKPEMVISRLKAVDFDQEETLNFSLLHNLLKTNATSDMVVHFMNQLKKTEKFDFIGQYLNYGQELPKFITALYTQWTNVLEVILNERPLSTDLTKQFALLTLYNESIDVVEKANINGCITDYISRDDKFLNIEQPKVEKLISGFKVLGVSFKKINFDVSNKELFSAVYQNSLYELNYDNLIVMLHNMYGVEDDEDIKHRNYTLVLSIPESPLNQTVTDNIFEYVDIILNSCDEEITDSLETIITLLNNPDVNIEQKERYIDFITQTIPLLSKLNDESLWSIVIDKEKLDFSEQNIISYYEKFKEIDQFLIKYINNWNSDIDMSMATEDFKNFDFFDSAVICEELNNDSYCSILKSMSLCYSSFNISSISTEKMKILIDVNIVCMNIETLEFMRENYTSEIISYFIQHNIDKYVSIIDEDNFSQNELVQILSSNVVDEFKLKLLKFSTGQISIVNTNYSVAIKLHILNNNLQSTDMVSLYQSYDEQPDEIKNFVIEYAKTNYKEIITNITSVSSSLKARLLASDLPMNKKIELFVAMAEYMSFEEATSTLVQIGLHEYGKMINPRSRPKMEVNIENRSILTLFVNKKWIDSFELDADRSDYYKIIKNR